MKLHPIQFASHLRERLASVVVADKGIHALSSVRMLASAHLLSEVPSIDDETSVGSSILNSFLSPNVERSIRRLLSFTYDTSSVVLKDESISMTAMIASCINEINIFHNITSVIPVDPADVAEGNASMQANADSDAQLKALEAKLAAIQAAKEAGGGFMENDIASMANKDVIEALKSFIADLHLDARMIDELSSDSETTVSMRLIYDKIVSTGAGVPMFGTLPSSSEYLKTSFDVEAITATGNDRDHTLNYNGAFDDYSRLILMKSKIKASCNDTILKDLRTIMYNNTAKELGKDRSIEELRSTLSMLSVLSLITDLQATSRLNTAIVAIQAPSHLENYIRSVLQVCDRVEIMVKARLFMAMQPIIGLLQSLAKVINSNHMMVIMNKIAPDALGRLDVNTMLKDLFSMPVAAFTADVLEDYSIVDGIARNGIPDMAVGILNNTDLFPEGMDKADYNTKMQHASFVLSHAVHQFVQLFGMIAPIVKNKSLMTMYIDGSVHFNTRKLTFNDVTVDVDNIPLLSTLMGRYTTDKPSIAWTGPECGHFFFHMPQPFNIVNSATHLSITPNGLNIGSVTGEVLPYSLSKLSAVDVLTEHINKANKLFESGKFNVSCFWTNPLSLTTVSRNVPISYPSEFLANVEHKYILRPDQCPLPGISWLYAGINASIDYSMSALDRSPFFESIVPGEAISARMLIPQPVMDPTANSVPGMQSRKKKNASAGSAKYGPDNVYALLFHYDEASFLSNISKHPFLSRLANYEAESHKAVFPLPFYAHHDIAKLMGHYALVSNNPIIAPLWIDIPQRIFDLAWLDWSDDFFDDISAFSRRDAATTTKMSFAKTNENMKSAFTEIKSKIGRAMFLIEPKALISNLSNFSNRSVFNDFARLWADGDTAHSSKAGQDKLSAFKLSEALE